MKQITLSIAKKLGYFLAGLIVLLAILVAASRLVMPILDQHRADIERWATDILQTPVKIDRVRLSWFQYQPVVSLDRVTILDKQSKHPVMQIKRVHILISIPQSLWQRTFVLSGIVINGTEVTLHEAKSGEVAVEGFPALGGYSNKPYSDESKFADIFKWIASVPRLILRDIDIHYTNSKGILRYITLFDLHLDNTSTQHTITGKAILHQDFPTEVNVAAEWEGDPANLNSIKLKSYFYVSGFSIAQWLQGYSLAGWQLNSGEAVAKIWIVWENAALRKVQSELTAYDLKLHSDTTKSTYPIQRLSGEFGWKQEDDNQVIAGKDILIDLPDHLWPSSNFYCILAPNAEGKLSPKAINLGYLNLTDVQTAIFASPEFLDKEVVKTLKGLHITGGIESAGIIFGGAANDFSKISFTAIFNRISIAPWQKYPGIKNLSGDVRWLGTSGKMSLLSKDMELQLDSVFLQPLQLQQVIGNIDWQKQANNNWDINLNDIKLQNADINIATQGSITVSPNAEVSTDIQATINLPHAKEITRYLPMRAFDADLIKWLQQAFLAGSAVTTKAVFRGPVHDYPFDKGNGEFYIAANVKDVTLRFAPDWPELEKLTGTLVFAGRKMTIDIEHGDTLGIPLGELHAVIPYLGEDKPQILEIGSKTIKTDFTNGMAYIHASPLEQTIGKMFATSELHGPMQLKLGLTVPLSNPDNTKVQGLIDFNDVTMNLVPWGLQVDHLSGQVQFTEDSTTATGIKGQLFSHPLVLNLQTLKQNKQSNVIRASFTNQLHIADLEKWLKVSMNKFVQGAADVAGTIDFSMTAPIEVHLSSNLVGMKVGLPDQYAKANKDTRNFTADIFAQENQPLRLKATYGDLLGAALILERKQGTFKLNAINVGLGKSTLIWPAQSGLYISGQLDWLDWDKIKTYMDQTNTDTISDLELRGIDLQIGRLNLPGQVLANTRVQVTPSATAWQLLINNANINGQISLPRKLTPQSTITAQFQQLHLSDPATTTKSSFDVKSIPSIVFTANNVFYNSLPLGQISFKTAPSAKGMAIKSLTIDSGHANLKATADWTQNGSHYVTRLQGNATSNHVSAFLSNLGFDVHNFISSKGRVDFNLVWQDAPYSPALSSMNGKASFALGKGRIVEVGQTSGAKMDLGRMLSIFSLQTIPRRLSFDFSDVFQKGYSFDTFNGDFKFTNGDAYTSNTQFEGPVARVDINGRIGLGEKDYDLTLSVTPHVTSSIPVAATLLTGQPLIGIAALAVNQVIGSGVSKATTYYYAVHGPWSNPTWGAISAPRR